MSRHSVAVASRERNPQTRGGSSRHCQLTEADFVCGQRKAYVGLGKLTIPDRLVHNAYKFLLKLTSDTIRRFWF